MKTEISSGRTLPPFHFRAKNKLYPLERKTEITLSPYVEIGMYITSLKKRNDDIRTNFSEVQATLMTIQVTFMMNCDRWTSNHVLII